MFLLSVISLTFVLSPVRKRRIVGLSQRAMSGQDGIRVIWLSTSTHEAILFSMSCVKL